MFWRRRKRLDEEVDSHLEHEIADNLARGMDPASARSHALRTFGNVGVAKEKARELDPLYWLDTLLQDVRFAFRVIARNRWTSLTIVATLTLGIAINLSVFTLVNAALLRPWVREAPETFVSVTPRFSGRYELRYSDGGFSQPDYLRYRDGARSVQSLAAYRLSTVTLTGEESGTLRAGLVSCNVFDVMKPGAPILGRYLRPDECAQPLSAPVAVINEATWRMQFKSDPQIVGRVIHLNRQPFTVIGVAPGFTLSPPNSECEIWLPYSMLGALRQEDDYFSSPRAQWLNIAGRRAPGYSMDQVGQELALLARQADSLVPGRTTSLTVSDGSLAQDPDIRTRAPLIFGLTLGTAGLLLLLACVNVTTLLLSRAAARQREIAVRLSLGAGRIRLLRQLLTESLVLSGVAAAISFLLIQRVPAAIWKAIVPGPLQLDLSPDGRVIAFAFLIAAVSGVIAGLSPALESLRPQAAESLKGSSIAVTPGRRRSRMRNVLVAVQVALSLLLLVQASLFTRLHQRFFSYDPGFETNQVLAVGLALSGFKPSAAFYQELEARIEAMPGVVRTSYASLAPWRGRNSTELKEIDGRPLAETRDFNRDPARRVVSPDYFAALGIPLIRGRAFTANEVSGKQPVLPAVISEAMARRYWPGQDALGRRFRTSVVHQIVGICRDVQSVRWMQDDGPFYYVPHDPDTAKPAYLMVRVAGDTAPVAAAIRQIVRQLDSQMAVTATTLASQVELQGDRVKPVMLYGTIAGCLALMLALTGVYAVVSYSVSQRIPEIGIRVALGAERKSIVAMVMRSGAAPVCGGLIAGLLLALAAAGATQPALFGMNPRDPLTFTAVPAALLVTALIAIWIPARRAAALDPLTALRRE